MGMPGLIVTTEVGFFHGTSGVYSDARRRSEAAHHRLVGEHRDRSDVLVRDGHDRELVSYKAFVLQDYPHVGDANKAGTHPDAVVYGINDFSLEESCPNLFKLVGPVVDDICQRALLD